MSSSSSKRTDGEIQLDVLDQLRWDTRIDPTEIEVDVHDSVVTLTGTVSSWDKRAAAEEAAHRACAEYQLAPVTAGFVTLESGRNAQRHHAGRSVRSVVNLIDVRGAAVRLRRTSLQ